MHKGAEHPHGHHNFCQVGLVPSRNSGARK